MCPPAHEMRPAARLLPRCPAGADFPALQCTARTPTGPARLDKWVSAARVSPMMAATATATTRRADMFTADGRPSDDPHEHRARLGDERTAQSRHHRRRSPEPARQRRRSDVAARAARRHDRGVRPPHGPRRPCSENASTAASASDHPAVRERLERRLDRHPAGLERLAQLRAWIAAHLASDRAGRQELRHQRWQPCLRRSADNAAPAGCLCDSGLVRCCRLPCHTEGESIMPDSTNQLLLVQQLRSSDPGKRDAAARALRASTITDASVGLLLVQQLRSSDPGGRDAASRALQGSTISDASVGLALVQLLWSPDPDKRDAAARALQGSTITDGSVGIQLVHALTSSNPGRRDAAARAMQGTTITDPQAALLLATVRR